MARTKAIKNESSIEPVSDLWAREFINSGEAKMAEETKDKAPVMDAKAEPVVENPVEQEPETIESLKAKLAESERKAKNKEEEAARHFNKLQKFEADEKKRQEAELSELEKANKKAAELEAENKKLRTDSLKIQIAAKIGIPDALALRLQGETPEQIEEDAKTILATLPKPAAINPTNPAGGSPQQESEKERRARLGI